MGDRRAPKREQTSPTVSVVIPAFNAAPYLEATLESVLRQAVRHLEMLVVDDGSTDDTADLMQGYGPPVRYLAQKNRGVAAARNRGIAESRGQWVAFLDADDVWRPTKLARQLQALAANSEAGVCHTAFEVVDGTGAISEIRRRGDGEATVERLLLCGNVVGTPSTVVCDRSLLLELGGFDPSLSQCADWDLWVRLATRTRFAYVDEPLVGWRRHDRNMSRDVMLLERDSLRLLEKAFAPDGAGVGLGVQRRQSVAWNYTVLAGSYFRAGRLADALRCAVLALRHDRRQLLHLAGFPYRAAVRRAVALVR